jgi:hypothetical protein
MEEVRRPCAETLFLASYIKEQPPINGAIRGFFRSLRERVERRATRWLGGPDSNLDTHERCRLASQILTAQCGTQMSDKCQQQTSILGSSGLVEGAGHPSG